MFNLSSKSVAVGVFALGLLAFGSNASFSEGGASTTAKASALTLGLDASIATGSADGSNKAVASVNSDGLTEQYSSQLCTTCRARYYTPGTGYYMNYKAYVDCITQPCS